MWHSLLAVAGLLVLVIAGIPLARRNMRKVNALNDEMQSWAESHGYHYVYEDNTQFEGYSFYPFGQSATQRAYRVVTGTYGESPFAVYDFNFSSLTSGPGGATGNSTIYFAMLVIQLPSVLPFLQVTQRKNTPHHYFKGAIATGDEAFDAAYGLFATDQEYAKSAMSQTIKTGLHTQSFTAMRVEHGRLFLWHTRKKHDVALIDNRLSFAATVAAELPSAP